MLSPDKVYLANIQICTGERYRPYVTSEVLGEKRVTIWSGELYGDILDAVTEARRYMENLKPPAPADVEFVLRRLIDIVNNAGNLQAVTSNSEYVEAVRMVERLKYFNKQQ